MEIFVKIQKKKLLFDTEQEHFIALSLKKKEKEKRKPFNTCCVEFFPSKTVPFYFLS